MKHGNGRVRLLITLFMFVDKFSDERISCSLTRKSVRIMLVVSPSTLLVNLKISASKHYVVNLSLISTFTISTYSFKSSLLSISDILLGK